MAHAKGANVPELSKETKQLVKVVERLSKQNEKGYRTTKYLSPSAFKVLFFRKLSTALRSGWYLTNAMKNTLESPEIADWITPQKIDSICTDILDGLHPSDALVRLDVFSEYDLTFLRAGLDTGDYKIFLALAEDYETFLKLNIVE